MPGLTYTQYVTQVAQLAVVAPDDINFVTILPEMVNYAELRIYRELDLVSASASLSGPAYKLTAGSRNLSFPQNFNDGSSFVASEQINLILPAGATDPDAAERVPLLPTTKEFLDAVYGSSLVRAQPQYFVPFNETLFLVGPVPDANYRVEVIGVLRPGTIGYNPAIVSAGTGTTPNIVFAGPHNVAANALVWLTGFTPDAWNGPFASSVIDATTIQIKSPTALPGATILGSIYAGSGQSFLSQYLPDLFVMASMIYLSAFQRAFGAQSGDPAMAMSYETQYQTLLKSAQSEEARKKYEGAAWSSQSPATTATPTRG